MSLLWLGLDDGGLCAKIAPASEYELAINHLDFYKLGDVVHIPTNLLEVGGGEGHYVGELNGWDADVVRIELQKIHGICAGCVLFLIDDANTQLIIIIFFHKKSESIIAVDGLYDFVKVEHIHTELLGTIRVEYLKALGIQLEMDQ